MFPPEPASFRMWQPPQPFAANTCLPVASAATLFVPPDEVVVAVVVVDVEAGADVAGAGAATAALPATLATYAATSFASSPVTRSFGIPGEPVDVAVIA